MDRRISGGLKERVIVPMHKKEDPNLTENYRGITLLNTTYKLYAGERLKADMEGKKVLSDTQAAFRKGKSTIDNVFTMQQVIEKELKKKSGLTIYVCFVDLTAAIDTVNREKLWGTMVTRGIRKELIEKIRKIYQETENVV